MLYERIKDSSQISNAFQILKNNFYSTPENYEQLVDKIYSNGIVIVAKTDSIKGLIAFYANDHTSKRAYITSVLVSEELRGKGIGKRLLEECQRYCVDNGFKIIRLEVNKDNLPAISLYKKYGYISYDFKGKSIYMEKILTV